MFRLKLKQIKYFLIVFLSFLFFSCSMNGDGTRGFVTYPVHIRNTAYSYAERYALKNTVYRLGAQDPLQENVEIDCSGLVIRCYEYALEGTEYRLFQDDMSVADMAKIVKITNKPVKGDLIFMGAINSSAATHIAIFEKAENGIVYFIDATEREPDELWNMPVNGVSKRFYKADCGLIKFFGIMPLL